MIIGIITGLEFEADLVRRRVQCHGLADKIVVGTGLGRERARRAAGAALAEGASSLLSFGIAGGIDPALACGATLLATCVRAQGMPTIDCSASWISRWVEGLPGGELTKLGHLAHTEAILDSPAAKAAVFAGTGALAADMESYGVGEAAAAAGIPFAALRVIADTATDHVPEIALRAAAPDGAIQLADTLRRILRQPRQIPGLLRLGRSTGRARRRLVQLADVGAKDLFFAGA